MTNDRRYVLGAELRAEKSGNDLKIVARAVKYGARSKRGVPAAGCYERIMPGAFTRSLASGEDVKATLNHDNNFLLGRTANKTLRLMDAKDALRFEVRLNPGVQFHRDVHSLVEAGTLNECSFGFACDADGDSYSEEKDENGQRCMVRSIRSAKLLSVDLVANPAYGNGATSAEARSIAYEFVTAPNGEDEELRNRVAKVGKIVAADEAAVLEDAQNILRAAKLGNELRSDDFREKLATALAELGL